MSDTDIVLERDTANDEFASIVKIYVQSGMAVQKDDLIFDIENSKATQELRAPAAGILEHDLTVGASIDFGVPIARIVRPADVVPGDGTKPDREATTAAALSGLSGGRDQPDAGTGASVPDRAAGSSADIGMSDARSRTMESLARVHADTHHRPGPADATTLAQGLAAPLPAPANGPLGIKPGSGLPAARLPSPTRFSMAALAAIAETRLEAADFTQPFVTLADVRARGGQTGPQPGPPLASVRQSTNLLPPGQAIAGRKQAEIEALSKGAGSSMLSVLGVGLGALSIPRAPDSLFVDRITDLVIYEASRLMRKFPRLNAAYNDGRVVLHDAVHAGLAIDQGGRLVVYGIADADRLTLSDLAGVIANAVEQYVDHALTASDMSRATFTVTDLSTSELDFIFPLLPRGQSCILGITRSEQSGFRIFAGFDHRVTEGRDVGMFLDALRERLLSFGTSSAMPSTVAHCVYCERSVAAAVSKHREKGLLKIIDRQGREALCCASCWNGW